ncbi:MAG TPA: hypothetical protein VFZ86_08740 [Thermoleophilia bacterium]|nr:hypothetical protein [Thermoleophilia bacterium]
MSPVLAARLAALRARGAAALIALALAVLALPACGAGGSSVATPPASPAPASSTSSPAATSTTPSALASPTAQPSGGAVTTAKLARQFPAPSGPLDLRITGSARWGGVPVRHLTYRSEGAVVTGTLSAPDGAGPFPAVLYAPGVGCSRDMFAADIAALQRQGIAALVIDPPDGRDPYVRPITTTPDVAAEAHVRYVTDLRRGLDVLRSLPAIDADRLGYVGYSWGGFVGGYLGGLRAPVRAYVLTYAGADWVGADPTAADGFAADPAAAVGAAPGGSYLFIAGVGDPLFSRASVTRYARAAPGGRRIEWLPGGHGDYWAAPAASGMHRSWLLRRL